MPAISYFECSRCQHRLSADAQQSLCPIDAAGLLIRYDLKELKHSARRRDIASSASASTASPGMWRYASILPDVAPVTLGEGWTPMIQSRRYSGLRIKEEGANPTGTFQSRALGMAVSMAKHFGLRHLAIASAGNSAGTLAAYAAAAGMSTHLFMPQDVPFANYLESILYGADVISVSGLQSDCARALGEKIKAQKEEGTPANELWLNISTFGEPFCVEGIKTMGYELVEQLGWAYPDAVFYPTEESVGLIAIWKAFEEMEQLGWVTGKRPKIYAVRTIAGVPITKAADQNTKTSGEFRSAATFASGQRTPNAYGDINLEIIEKSGGKSLAVTEDETLASLLDWARMEGLFLSPEGAAAAAAYRRLLDAGDLKPSDTVVLLNTGAGLKYADRVAEAMHLRRRGNLPTSLPVGGIITPV